MMRIKTIHQTLKFLFSQQPKNIPKPSPIQFDFQIPSKTHPSKSKASSQDVVIIKAKRNVDVSKILKKKQQGQQYNFKVQESYQKLQQTKIQQNLKTIKYHEDEYMKGQHLIENVPLDPFYSYKLADFQRKNQQYQENFKNFVAPYKNFDLIAQNKFKLAEQYHEKQQKYQVQQFLRYLDKYPGSPKGPKPEDDLDFYMEYAYKKMPSVLSTYLEGKEAQKDDKIKRRDTNDMEKEKFRMPQESHISSILSTNRSLQPPLEKEEDEEQDHISQFAKASLIKEYEDIPELPEMQFVNYHQYMKDYTNWRNFKNYHVQKCADEAINADFEYLFKVELAKDPEPQNEYYVPRGKAPSLLRYYKTLPKQMQDHPAIKDIVLGLEFLCPYVSYEEKEQVINLACTMVLPLDKVSHRAMSDFIAKKKEYMTPFMVDKIFSINPQYTWDISEFFAEIKRQQLKGQSMVQQNERSYPEPPQVHLEWEQGVANLPIDFYNNDDGFWDEIISEKLKRQDQAKPMMKVRKHFLY